MRNEHTHTPRKESSIQNSRQSPSCEGCQGENPLPPAEIPPLLIVSVFGQDFLCIHGKFWVRLTDDALRALQERAIARFQGFDLSLPQA